MQMKALRSANFAKLSSNSSTSDPYRVVSISAGTPGGYCLSQIRSMVFPLFPLPLPSRLARRPVSRGGTACFRAVLGHAAAMASGRGAVGRQSMNGAGVSSPVGSTSPLWGEVDLRSKSGEGVQDYRGTAVPHPNPLPSKSDISDFDNLRCPTRVNPSWVGRGGAPALRAQFDLISPRVSRRCSSRASRRLWALPRPWASRASPQPARLRRALLHPAWHWHDALRPACRPSLRRIWRRP